MSGRASVPIGSGSLESALDGVDTPQRRPDTTRNAHTVSAAEGDRLHKEVANAHKPKNGTNKSAGSAATLSAEGGERLKQEYYQVVRGQNRSFRQLGNTIRKRQASKGELSRQKTARTLAVQGAAKFESFDYDYMETPHLRAQHASLTGNILLFDKQTNIVKWILTMLIGIVLGALAYVMTLILAKVMNWKLKVIKDYVHDDKMTTAYAFHIGVVVILMICASLLCNMAPASAGSGIPVVKAFLNGNRIRGMLGVPALIAKFFGVMCCVTAGMPAGREGPMVHLGAIVSAGLARGQSKLLPQGFSCFHYNTFSDAKNTRDFVSIGAAAGVAAAFNAPVGGILFSLEEVSSFWSDKHMYGVFIAATLASATLNMLLTVQHGGKTVSDEGLILFGQAGQFEEFSFTDFHYWEVALFAGMGILGGVLGGIFCTCNKALTVQRKRFYAHMELTYATPTASRPNPVWTPARLKCVLTCIESALTMFVVGSIFFWLPTGFDCRPTDSVADKHILAHGGEHGLSPIEHNCYYLEDPHKATAAAAASAGSHAGGHRQLAGGATEKGAYFNDMATLIFNPQEGVAKQLFSRSTAGFFRIKTLAAFVAVYFPCACYCYGLFVPAGLFVPSLISGAAIGRLVGELVRSAGVDQVDPGMYSLIGAAAVLGGITRMTISLAVILIELTNDINFLLPILLTLAFAKMTGDALSHSIYDIHMGMSGVPYLEADPPDDFSFRICQDAMHRPVVTLKVIEDLSVIRNTLGRYSHNAFPIIDPGKTGLGKSFVGLATREVLEKLVADADESSASTRDGAGGTGAGAGGGAPEIVVEGNRAPVTPGRGKIKFDESEGNSNSNSNSNRRPSALAAMFKRGESLNDPGTPGSPTTPKTPRRNSLLATNASQASSRRYLGSPSVKQLVDSKHRMMQAVQLENSMDPSPFAVQEALPLSRAYRLFTRMGLRHLVVLNQEHVVTGIITRKDFAFGHDAPLREQTKDLSLRYIRDSSARASSVNQYRRRVRQHTDDSGLALSPQGSRSRSSSF